MKLKEICHSRTGDKGDISNISLIPWNEADYPMLKEKVTAQRVKEYFSDICKGTVTRYEVDGICALNFVMEQALGGGVLRSLAMDKHGKALSSALLEMEVE
ncbi:AtuA-related protein [Flavonifractor sp. HCP28S3_F3]|uniref:AtuA-related protein n=1 Tax=Flavonifractor sp. HCP28S3_F3 TaxID=3438939 RepID=UPI003F89BB00